MNLSMAAMLYAHKVHDGQVRRYTGENHFVHLAQTVALVSSATIYNSFRDQILATAWLHDSCEDQDVTYPFLEHNFGHIVAEGVALLTDAEEGNRAERKEKSRQRLAAAPADIQTIKVADIISNSMSIMLHDPKFAVTWVPESIAMVEALKQADDTLRQLAFKILKGPANA